MSPADFERWLLIPDRRPLVMGILNVTPDSFSDGGENVLLDAAIAHADEMIAQGTDLLDVGGESTRPGAVPISTDEQIGRVVPVIERLRSRDVAISIDTTDARVAAAALDAGAAIVNDVSAAQFDSDMLSLVARRGVPIVLMHMLGTSPDQIHVDPIYVDVVAEVRAFLLARATAAINAGVASHRVLLDIGIGFSKSMAHTLTLLREYATFTNLGYPTLLGASRKGFISRILGGDLPPKDRVIGTAATTAWCVTQGASIVRVHDVTPNLHALRIADAIRRETV